MKRLAAFTLSFVMTILLTSCGGSGQLTVEEMLVDSGWLSVPTQADFPDDGAAIINEQEEVKLYLDSGWSLQLERKFYRSMVYFNDKAESYLTEEIYLDPDVMLNSFSARTIKPNGEIIELTEKDLRRTQLTEGYVDFSDDESVKFTFQGVEPGSIVEYSYTTTSRNAFWSADVWYVQKSIPTLYTRYTIDIPNVVLQADYMWDYEAVNTSMPQPVEVFSIMNKKAIRKDKSVRQYWEFKNIPGLENESYSPPYRDIAQYVVFSVQFEDWNDLTGRYWSIISKKFDEKSWKKVEALAKEIAGDETDQAKIIEKVFHYTQQKYRYVAIHIDDSGIIPNDVEEIIRNKYGDCKDMTALNVNLLRALGIDAYPGLVNTKGRMIRRSNRVALDFNHMIALAVTKEGKEYWLDATGSNCPLGEVYSSIEGRDVHLIDYEGKHFVKTIPTSKSYHNQLTRNVILKLADEGNLEGKAEFVYTGEKNLDIRSSLKDVSENDMTKIITRRANSNLPDLKIENIVYDDPSAIADTFRYSFTFSRNSIGTATADMALFNPFIFAMPSDLDVFNDKPRHYAVVEDVPFRINDNIQLQYNPDKYELKSQFENITAKNTIGTFVRSPIFGDNGGLTLTRQLVIDTDYIAQSRYEDLRDLHKATARANEENIVLNKKN